MLPEQAENVLGALSLALSDRMHDAVCGASGQSASGAAALSALLHFDIDLTVDLLAKVLGVSSSGAVRVVDRLVAAGLVRRRVARQVGRDGADGRVTWIGLTAAGRRAAARVSGARQAVLAHALRTLDEEERSAFGDLAGRVLAGLVRPPGAVRWTCRLCDTAACHRPDGLCPAATAAGSRSVPPA